jgi:hypothetical protein
MWLRPKETRRIRIAAPAIISCLGVIASLAEELTPFARALTQSLCFKAIAAITILPPGICFAKGKHRKKTETNSRQSCLETAGAVAFNRELETRN